MKKVTVYSTNYCPYCSAAKALLKAKGVGFEEVNVEDDDEKRDWLVEKTGQTTVPQIFIDDVSYGGFQELQTLDQEGKLEELLGTE